MDYAAIRADYCNIKNIQGRKTIQIILEIPIERAHQLYDSLGWPNAHEPKKVVIALLNEDTNG
jgi:hypothetical protein